MTAVVRPRWVVELEVGHVGYQAMHANKHCRASHLQRCEAYPATLPAVAVSRPVKKQHA